MALKPCVCGNPLGLANCCGKKIKSKPWTGVPVKKTVREAIDDLTLYIQHRQLDKAAVVADAILSKIPNHPKANYLLGMSAFLQGQPQQAQQLIAKAFEAGLKDAAAHLNYANIVGQMGREDLALEHLLIAVEVQPGLKQAWVMGAQIAQANGDHESALKFTNGLMTQWPEESAYWKLASDSLHALIRDEEAIDVLEKGLSHHPGQPELELALAGILELRHELTKASEIVDRLLQAQPAWPEAVILAARIARREGQLDKAQVSLESIEASRTLDDSQKNLLNAEFTLLYAKQEAFEKAWESAKRMNQAARRCRPPQGNLEQLSNFLTGVEKVSGLLDLTGDNSEASLLSPLYVTGFPRVGSTLIEKLLLQQFNCTSVSESDAVPRLEKRLFSHFGKPWWEEAVFRDVLSDPGRWKKELSHFYRTHQDTNQASTQSILDKNLFNSMRVPLLSAVVPGAIVLRVVRHPLDTLISNFFANFMSPDSWHTDVLETANYIAVADAHWSRIKDVQGIRCLEVRYEEIVRSGQLPETLTKELAGSWASPREAPEQETCVHQTRTASYEQVQGGVHSKSVNNFRHYLPLIDKRVIEILEPMMARWDYAL
ncbi:tetratricopeptide repeat-containing sulfotransferase family protein [Hahella ganghwensis]|uniref:tetratricopeptide repeat-containing sulfotransferase family protein n=1 Tax=Hahella ganghwensis TaxID=286420 RepID=UPI00036EC5AD|nr:sulfotransferase [Hahella ganghwensis]